MEFIIREDGSFDLIGRHVRLLGCYPAIEGRSLRPTGLKIEKDSVCYGLARGCLRLHFRLDEDERLVLDCAVEGLAGVHDISPLAHGQITGAERVFAQGFGMEGPSGSFSLGENVPDSHGLTVLYSDSGVLLAYAEDHRRFSLHFSASDSQNFAACFNLEKTRRVHRQDGRLRQQILLR